MIESIGPSFFNMACCETLDLKEPTVWPLRVAQFTGHERTDDSLGLRP